METKTCPRCKGTGLVSSPVCYAGVPGGCYQCDLKGVVVWASKEDLNAKVDEGIKSYLAEIEGRAAEAKANFASYSDEKKAKYAPVLEANLSHLRALWKEVKSGSHPCYKYKKKGQWVSVYSAPQKASA